MADHLLDTNILILHLRERAEATALLTTWAKEGTLYISVVTRTEILAGMHSREEEKTMELLASLASLPVDEVIADRAGRLIYQYARQGIQLSFPDVIITATALQNSLILATTNPDHFPIPNLQLYPFTPVTD
ncbi:type II toxin-antitoxin system VapC family toxin [Dehalococcoidia bacterium]|nr:type II toxin-antitoxin system VapC family toxin [Dehalococcoidia bacterium]